MKRLLIVEDDYITRTLLKEVLANDGYEVHTSSDAPEALVWLKRNGLPHLALVDLGLPSMHGFELCKDIKKMGDVPIVILTGDGSRQTVIAGIREYADDFITKPFDVEEVILRIRRVLSRVGDHSFAQSPVTVIDNHLSIDFPNQRIMIDGQAIELTPTEAGLLYHLVRNKGKIVTPETLMARVWPNEPVNPETLRVHMSRLRRKVSPGKDTPKYIYTERELGYSFRLGDEAY